MINMESRNDQYQRSRGSLRRCRSVGTALLFQKIDFSVAIVHNEARKVGLPALSPLEQPEQRAAIWKLTSSEIAPFAV